MRMFLTMLVVGLAIGLVASHAGATSYTPTATPDLSVFGSVVYGDPNAGSGDTFGPVAFGTTGFSGSLHSWVLEDASDNLTFVYRLAIDASSTTDIDMFRLMNATQPFLAVDDSVILGAGYNSTLAGTYPDGVPLWIESYPNDLVPAFEYGWTNPLPPIFDTVGLAPGSTVELYVRTTGDVVIYNVGAAVIDGGSASVTALGPIWAPQNGEVPEPVTLLLLASGLAALGISRRRK